MIMMWFLCISCKSKLVKKWAIARHNKTDNQELFDQQDKSITSEMFQSQTGLDPKKYRALTIGTRSHPEFIDTKTQYMKIKAVIETANPFVKLDPEVESALLLRI